MQTMESMLMKEIKKLEKIVEEAGKRLERKPQGHLRIIKKRGNMEYYLKSDRECGVNDKDKNIRYLKKSEKNLAKEIAQRDYDVHLVKYAEERISAINVFLKKYDKTSLQKLYEKTNSYRKELIDFPIISDEEYIKRWQAVKYTGKTFSDGMPDIITERGERVRSKSEKIIADKLYALGIPYRYEYPLILEENIKMHPDFTVLRMPEREEVYLEHFGLMDNCDYVEGVIKKLNTYERNGIYLGVNLFITHETSKTPLNTRALDGMIKQLFCVESE